jgi:hypothetical protein
VASGFMLAFAGCVTPVDVLEEAESEPLWHYEMCLSEEEIANTGDGCDFPCEMPDAIDCGGCETSAGRCASWDFACDKSSTLRATKTVMLDCDPTAADWTQRFDPDPAFLWSDCREALSFGRTGEACDAPWTCARLTDDPCCVEVAACGSLSYGPASWPDLLRGRICSIGCEKLTPEPERPLATNCDHAFEGALRAGLPCSGDYVCLDDWQPAPDEVQIVGELTQGSTLSVDVTASPYLAAAQQQAQADAFHWCGNGVVQSGRYPFRMWEN